MQNDVVLKKLNFFTPRVRGPAGKTICYLVAKFYDSNKFDLQLDSVLKKLNFDVLTQSSSGWVL